MEKSSGQGARDGGATSRLHAEGDEECERDGVCLVVPFEGSLKRLGINGAPQTGAGGEASLAAALSRSTHRRTASLPSASAIQIALDISDALAAAHAQRPLAQEEKKEKSIPVIVHLQMSVQADIKAVVPRQGHLSMQLSSATIALTQYLIPLPLSATTAHIEKSLCVLLEQVELQLVKHQVGTGPRIVASKMRANLLSSLVPAPTQPRQPHGGPLGGGGGSGGDLKSEVLGGKRRHVGVTLDITTLEAKQVHLDQVDGTFAHKIVSAWMPPAAALGASSMKERAGAVGVAHPAVNASGAARSQPMPSSVDVTLRVRDCRADVHVMRDVRLTYDTYDEANQGLYATASHYSKPVHPPSSSRWALRGKAGSKEGGGKLMSQSEMCFKLHKSRLRSCKYDKAEAPLSQAIFYFPDVQAAGTMKTRFNCAVSPAAAPLLDPRGVTLASGAGDPLENAANRNVPSITDVNVIFSIKEMCNEVRQDMLNFLLEMQRTMKAEINTFLQATEKYAASLGKKREIRAATGAHLQLHLTFLLMGIRLRAVAPDSALLLDTGFFTFEVVGRPAGAQAKKHDKALQWKIGLEGLSIAATSCHQRPGSQGSSLAREPTVNGNGGGGGQKTWVLAHVRTNVEMQNSAEELTLDPCDIGTPASSVGGGAARPAPSLSKEPSTFSLNLAHTEAIAHPGSIGCLRLLYNHFNQAVAKYQHQRQFIQLEELDNSIQRMVRTGRDAAQGRFKKAAPVLISNLCVQVAVKDTWLSLMNSHEIPASFAFSVPTEATPAAIFEAINLRDLSKRATGSATSARSSDDNSLIAFLELIELRAQSSSQGVGGSKEILSHLEFKRFEIAFASAHKILNAQRAAPHRCV